MATGTEILVLAGTVSSGFFIFSLTRGAKMMDDRRPLAKLLWYAGGLIPLAFVCLVWASMGDQPVLPQRILLFVLGGAIGGFTLLAAGEMIRPIKAETPGAPMTTGDKPPINITGSNNILNFGSAGDITQNSPARSQQAMRDPDGIYQLDQKVGTVVAAEIDRSQSLVFFKQIQNAPNFDTNRDFQYREYVLHFADATDRATVSGIGTPTNKAYNQVQCRIIGIISQ